MTEETHVSTDDLFDELCSVLQNYFSQGLTPLQASLMLEQIQEDINSYERGDFYPFW
jgi:hypothetical protein